MFLIQPPKPKRFYLDDEIEDRFLLFRRDVLFGSHYMILYLWLHQSQNELHEYLEDEALLQRVEQQSRELGEERAARRFHRGPVAAHMMRAAARVQEQGNEQADQQRQQRHQLPVADGLEAQPCGGAVVAEGRHAGTDEDEHHHGSAQADGGDEQVAERLHFHRQSRPADTQQGTEHQRQQQQGNACSRMPEDHRSLFYSCSSLQRRGRT